MIAQQSSTVADESETIYEHNKEQISHFFADTHMILELDLSKRGVLHRFLNCKNGLTMRNC